MLTQGNNETAVHYYLRVAAEYIKKNCPDKTIDYDDTTCDGYCLVDDLEALIDEINLGAIEVKTKNINQKVICNLGAIEVKTKNINQKVICNKKDKCDISDCSCRVEHSPILLDEITGEMCTCNNFCNFINENAQCV